MSVEKPRYTVIESREGYEIREYEPYILAQTEVEGKYGEASNQGFRVIADYIFGNNVKRESIAMTAPVTQEEAPARGEPEKITMMAPVLSQEAEGRFLVSFIMPSKYTMDTLPVPLNPRVRLVPVPKHRTAVIRFSGTASEREVEKRKTELLSKLTADGLSDRIASPFRVARYDPPWTLPFLRRNEVMVDIDGG